MGPNADCFFGIDWISWFHDWCLDDFFANCHVSRNMKDTWFSFILWSVWMFIESESFYVNIAIFRITVLRFLSMRVTSFRPTSSRPDVYAGLWLQDQSDFSMILLNSYHRRCEMFVYFLVGIFISVVIVLLTAVLWAALHFLHSSLLNKMIWIKTVIGLFRLMKYFECMIK